jgi:hypothetical protein
LISKQCSGDHAGSLYARMTSLGFYWGCAARVLAKLQWPQDQAHSDFPIFKIMKSDSLYAATVGLSSIPSVESAWYKTLAVSLGTLGTAI